MQTLSVINLVTAPLRTILDWRALRRATQPHGSATAAKGALLHAAARLPTAVSPIAAAPLARVEKLTPDVAAGALLGANA